MKRTFIFAILISFLTSLAMTGQGIKGEIVDSNGDPVPYASIFIKELTRGTTCNAMGRFSLPLPPGEYQIYFRSLGYTEVQKKVVVEDDFLNLEIFLPPQTYMIPEVRVSASGEDPSYWIMRKAIGLAHYHLNEVLNYNAEIYIKGTALFKKIPRAIAKRVEVNDFKVKENEAYMLESLNEVKYTAPDKYDMKVIASQNTLPGYTESVNPMDYVNASLYQPQIETFISPLARNAFYHYNFSFVGSFLEGEYIIAKIKVTPKRKSQQLCEGHLYIVEDLWCLYSSDIAINTIAGTLYLSQLYANVIMDAWLPVNHKISMAVDIAGVDANVTYVSSLKYSNVVLNPNLPKTYFTATSAAPEPGEDEPPSKEQEKIDELLKKNELSNRDVTKLSKLMEKETEKGRIQELEEPLNITGTSFTVAEDAVKNDSNYWNSVRPIPLTPEESITLTKRDSIISVSKPATESDSAKVRGRGKSIVSGIVFGRVKRYSQGKIRLRYGGLLDMENLDFNTVNGFAFSQNMTFEYKLDSIHTYRYFLKAGYAFHRKAPMINFRTDFLYAPMSRGKIELSFNYSSFDFNGTSGMGRFTNIDYTLLYRENYLKLYEKINAALFNHIDLTNGLNLQVRIDIGKLNSLSNNTDFSFFFKGKKDYTANLPDTTMNADDPYLVDRKRFAVDAKLSYTPRNYYTIRNNRKVMRGSDWPTFSLNYSQGIPLDNQLWSQYSYISTTVKDSRDVGLLSTLDSKISGGYYFNNSSMHFSDFNHFKSFPLLFDLIGFTNSYHLLDYYESSTNEYWIEGHLSLTTPYLLIKLLPWFSERFWTETVGISYLKTPGVNHYMQAGYSMNDIMFLLDLGVYVGFEDMKYSGFGFRANLKF